GIAIAIALVRGFARHSAREIGNFWVDLTRCTLYLLLPVCVVGTIVLVALGVPQNLNDYTSATTLAGAAQTIGQGPVASQEIIKEFGTNGGGFFNANSAHPFENPTPFTNLLEMVAIFAIPAGLTYTFGKMVGHTKQGWAILAAMSVLFLIGVTVATVSKREGNPLLTTAGADQSREIAGRSAPGGNMEGKESRFGITASSLFAVITTAASCGAVNSMHDSFTPLGGLVPLANIGLGEVIFGYGDDKVWFVASITAWLWFTVLFANFAEAMAEGRGKAQADALRKTRTETKAKLMVGGDRNRIEERASAELRPGDLVLVEAGDTIPSDGEVVEGVAYVSEAAITGESAPVLKEPGTDIASSVTGGTQVISDHLVVRITAEPGKTFLDRMIALVEGAARQKTPNEIALNILLAGLTIIFLIVVVALNPFSRYAGASAST
ncbi:MAG: potassium-transporting ATPase potassium-binding subunit, partial [Thermomicrobiales bacterium]|nr:potassium-transporting ATPase potassium-binding subunit [Thermomicrobiales bacterium]